ncbi:hypothetical protein [Rickettsia endosymbiont of Proechinophthirus fluctus]|uniref:hypothetical protein n=1 Tax=Rickettsia endosymbiont of Proechinophthirus fluctus TaxID=1462733 RepID=UPI002093B4A3|nr:hypothetical protein [Rickettsia endosymbiont of Proechinophthirus fluctus]
MYSKIHKSSNYYQEAQYYLGECYFNQEEFTEAGYIIRSTKIIIYLKKLAQIFQLLRKILT